MPTGSSDHEAINLDVIGKHGSVINFAILPDRFPSEQHARYSAYKLREAAVQWNALDIGVTFKWVDKLEDAAFALAYGGNQGTVYASAFWPSNKDLQILWVYEYAFLPEKIDYQSNVFLRTFPLLTYTVLSFFPEVLSDSV